MRLLYVIDSIGRGGAEASLAAMAPGLVESGIEFHVLPLSTTRLQQSPLLAEAGVDVHQHLYAQNRIGNIRSVHEVARKVRPDLVHTTLYEADIAGRVAARALGMPVSTSIVSDSYSGSHYREVNTIKLHMARAADALTSLQANRFHAITAVIAHNVGSRLGIPQRKIDVIPRGRDPQAFPFRPAAVRKHIRQELQIEDRPVVLAIGRHEPPKGLQHLLKAASVVADSHPGLVVLIAGREGRATAELQMLADQTRADVRFLGHRSDVANLLAGSDMVCFPSEREGFGGVLVEAMAVGCPVVASDIPTSVEVLDGDGLSPVGLLAPTGDVDALARAINQVLNDPEGSTTRADQARKRFEEHYTIEKVVAQMVGFFERAKSGTC